MGLFSATVLAAIYTEARDAGLAAKRQVMFSGFDPDVQASIMADGAGQSQAAILKLDLARLNALTEPIADGSYVLAIWLETAVQDLQPVAPARAQKFADWATELKARPTLRSDPEVAVKEIVEARSDPIAAPGAVNELAEELAGYIDQLAAHADILVRSKRLHDSLHSLQTGPLPMLRQVGLMKPDDPMFPPLAVSTLSMFESAATGISADIASLAPASLALAPNLAQLAQTLVAALRDQALAARTAAQANDRTAFANALGALRVRIKDDMSSLESEIDQRIGSMQPGQPLALDQLLTALEKLAGQTTDAKIKAAAESAAKSLTVIRIDLSMIGRRHHDWQALDSQLWLVEAVFDQLVEGKDLGIIFQTMWNDVVNKIKLLAGSPRPVWADQIDALTGAFVGLCPLPPQLPLVTGTDTAFGAVVGQVRATFRDVDLNLKASCEGLGTLTAQLAKL